MIINRWVRLHENGLVMKKGVPKELIDDAYALFVSDVAKARGLDATNLTRLLTLKSLSQGKLCKAH